MDSPEQPYQKLIREQEQLLDEVNIPLAPYNRIIQRYKNPIFTGAHTPLLWHYNINPDTNPLLMEQFGINAIFNS